MRAHQPDFLIVGVPKAGTTALHDALALHPQLFASTPKEPKFFLTDGHSPARREHRGPGDAHSRREWIWSARQYERIFAQAPADSLRFESTPFYLWSRPSHRRIAAALGPDVKLIAVIRDPIDRAFSNWSHLRADGLEPEDDFVAACRAERRRAEAGWAPFWRYLELGKYGEQFEHLFRHVPRDNVRVYRYRQLIDTPQQTLDDVCGFLGVETGLLSELPDSNVGRWAPHTPVNSALRRVVRAGAQLGSFADPRMWRAAERPLRSLLQRGAHSRPRLTPEQRGELLPVFAADNALLCEQLEQDYTDWLAVEGRGMYTVRRS